MDSIINSTFDYIKKNIFVIIDKEVQYSSDDGDSYVVNYLFNRPLPLQNGNRYGIWTSSWNIFGFTHMNASTKAKLYTFPFFNLCGPCASLMDHYRLWNWIPEVGDCFINYVYSFEPVHEYFCSSNRELIIKAAKEVLKSYNLLQDEDT